MHAPHGHDEVPGMPPTSELQTFLKSIGLLREGDDVEVWPLTGGVSSDIHAVATSSGLVCVKRALPKLKVRADWRAPVIRSTYEARWLDVVAGLVPGAAPRVLGHDSESGYLAMEYLDPADHEVWKSQLLAGTTSATVGSRVGRLVGSIHAAAHAKSADLASQFDTTDLFMTLRIEPYLLAVAKRHSDLSGYITTVIEGMLQHRITLVHGDVSPKNILVDQDEQPLLLDAECAWWGDPAFDLAFCCNHLLLKQLAVPSNRDGLRHLLRRLVDAYVNQVDWEPVDALLSRTATLVPLLTLARIDGKSPVEYLTVPDQNRCRRIAHGLATAIPVPSLDEVFTAWEEQLDE